MAKEKFKTVHYLIQILKEYGIKNIVASPGTQNSTFNYLVQKDKDFKCYSVVDERSASYVALGISNATTEPAAITCTGATAARNYMSAMTEAYYRNIPVVALTFYNPTSSRFNMAPQYTDRSLSQNDIKEISVTLPEIKDSNDKTKVITALNAVLSTAKNKSLPVHINCPASFNYEIEGLPSNLWSTKYYSEDFSSLKNELKNKKFAVFLGEHHKFDEEEQNAISRFAKSYNIPVFCDHSSNYCGENKVLLTKFRHFATGELRPELILEGGGISGLYLNGGIFLYAGEVWRFSKNAKYNARYDIKTTKLLIGSEKTIFEQLTNDERQVSNYYGQIKKELDKISYPDFPLSLLYMAKEFASRIPQNSNLHLAILRPFESVGCFDIPNSVTVSSNVGGFGIDGALSTSLGLSLADENKKTFCVIGDLAFFYDMNILGNRHVKNNLRILLENNSEGETMRFNRIQEDFWHDESKELVSAAGHYKNGAKGWAESCGFHYMSASTKEEYISQIDDFCNKDFDKPVIFEVFTTLEKNKEAHRVLDEYYKNTFPEGDNVSFFEQFFSVKKICKNNKNYKLVRVLGAKIKIEEKNEKNK